MADRRIYTEAGKAVAEAGQVMLDGPDGIAISMTPDAAEGTARELSQAAADARQQEALPEDSPPSAP